MMVASAGVPASALNDLLGPHGFAPVLIVSSLAELTSKMRVAAPTIVVVPVGDAGQSADFSSFETELRRQPDVSAIGTAPVKDADTVLVAMRAGELEFVQTPVDTEDLRAAVSRLLSRSSAAQAPGALYAVHSGKGGLGTSTIAASLAWEFAHPHGSQRAALVDFTTTGAGVRVMLNVNPLYDLGNISARRDRIDSNFLRSVMLQHPEGVSVLAAADEVDAADPLDVPSVGSLFHVLRRDFAATVVDTDHHLADQTLAALDAADRIVLVTALDVSALRSAQRTIGVFNRLGYDHDKLMVVANRRSDRDRITMTDAERVLGRPVSLALPNDYASCADAITHGQFVQHHASGSPLVSGFRSLANLLSGIPVAADARRGDAGRPRLARLFGRG